MTQEKRAFGWVGRLGIALILMMVGLKGLPAQACDLTITDVTSTQWTGNHGRGYEVYDSQRGALLVTFHVQSQTGGCPYFVTVSPSSAPGGGPGALRGPGETLRYELFKDASATQPLKPTSVASTPDVFVGSAPSGTSVTAWQFVMVIWANQIVLPGLYSDDIQITAYEGQVGNGILRDQRHVPSSAVVPAVAEISFSAGGAFDPNVNTYTIRFNAMRKNDRQQVSLKARSNGGYRIQFGSLNGGVMRNVNPNDDSTVPYRLTVDGAAVTLPAGGGARQAISNANPTPATGYTHTLEFHILKTEGASAGDYQDVVNISVVSLR